MKSLPVMGAAALTVVLTASIATQSGDAPNGTLTPSTARVASAQFGAGPAHEHLAQAQAPASGSVRSSLSREHLAQAPASGSVRSSINSRVHLARASQVAVADGRRTLVFLDVRGAVNSVDLEPSGDSPGDTLFFDNTLRDPASDSAVGQFPSRCTLVAGSRYHCQGTLSLARGTIELATTVDFAVEAPIVSAVTGGTGRYQVAAGQARITPTDTAGTSRLVVRLGD